MVGGWMERERERETRGEYIERTNQGQKIMKGGANTIFHTCLPVLLWKTSLQCLGYWVRKWLFIELLNSLCDSMPVNVMHHPRQSSAVQYPSDHARRGVRGDARPRPRTWPPRPPNASRRAPSTNLSVRAREKESRIGENGQNENQNDRKRKALDGAT